MHSGKQEATAVHCQALPSHQEHHQDMLTRNVIKQIGAAMAAASVSLIFPASVYSIFTVPKENSTSAQNSALTNDSSFHNEGETQNMDLA